MLSIATIGIKRLILIMSLMRAIACYSQMPSINELAGTNSFDSINMVLNKAQFELVLCDTTEFEYDCSYKLERIIFYYNYDRASKIDTKTLRFQNSKNYQTIIKELRQLGYYRSLKSGNRYNINEEYQDKNKRRFILYSNINEDLKTYTYTLIFP